MTEWQPISTAPKDGTPIMLFARSRLAQAPVRVIGWHIDGMGWIESAFHPNKPVGLVPFMWQHLPDWPASTVGDSDGDDGA